METCCELKDFKGCPRLFTCKATNCMLGRASEVGEEQT